MAVLDGATPLFVLGPARSGTTFLARILNAHPGILQTNEIGIFLLLDSIIKQTAKGVASGVEYPKERVAMVSGFWRENAKELILALFARLAIDQGKGPLRYWGDKHPHHCNCLDFISSLFPDARFIFLMRDPRDAICSLAEMNRVPIRKAITGWAIFAARYDDFFARNPEAAVYALHYEQLARMPEVVVGPLFAWLGLSWPSPEVGAFLEQHGHVEAHELFAPEPSRVNLEEKVGRWRKAFTSEDVEACKLECERFMARWNYTWD